MQFEARGIRRHAGAVLALTLVLAFAFTGVAAAQGTQSGTLTGGVKSADGAGLPGVTVDGQDVDAVYSATAIAVDRARRGNGPTLIEARTYRFDEHQVGLIIPGQPYRCPEEVEKFKAERDPIKLFRSKLSKQTVVEAQLSTIDSSVADAAIGAIFVLDHRVEAAKILRVHEEIAQCRIVGRRIPVAAPDGTGEDDAWSGRIVGERRTTVQTAWNAVE